MKAQQRLGRSSCTDVDFELKKDLKKKGVCCDCYSDNQKETSTHCIIDGGYRWKNGWMRVSFCVFFFGIATLLTGVRWSATPKTETFNATTKTRIYMYIIVRVLYDDVDIMCVIIST